MNKEPVALIVDKVSQYFDVGDERVDVLKDISFKLHQKTFNIIYGPSGSGKSTLLNILTGLLKPTDGTIEFNGKVLYNLKPDEIAYFRAFEVGMVYQQNFWVKSLNVMENVSMPLYFSGQTHQKAAKVALEALEKVGMADYSKKYPINLSGGEQQRVAMARAIVNNPRFIVADEPTGSLDSKNGEMIMGLLKQLRDEFDRTVILVTHNMEYIGLSDYLLHIQDGMVTEVTGSHDIKTIADELLEETRDRVSRLARLNNHA